MRWERRKPLWPIVAALGLLMMLAIAAPKLWRNRQGMRRDDSNSSSPLSVNSGTFTEPHLSVPEEQSAAQVTSAGKALPITREFDLDTLINVRDQLVSLLDQLPEVQPRVQEPEVVTAEPIPSDLTVRVTSENDRLAMLPPRPRERRVLPNVDESTSRAQSNSRAQSEAKEFAALLLEAARNPKPEPTFFAPSHSGANTRIAMAPAKPQNLEPAPAEEVPPTLVAPLALAPASPTPEPLTPEPPTPEPPTPETVTIETVTPETPTIEPPVQTPEVVEAPVIESPVEVAPTPVMVPALRHQPRRLITQLEAFTPGAPGALWSQQVLDHLRLLTSESAAGSPVAADAMERLLQLYQLGMQQSHSSTATTSDTNWQQAVQALGRRLILWRLLLDPNQPKVVQASPAEFDFFPVIDRISARLTSANHGLNWSEYLLLDRIVELMSPGHQALTLARAKLAQKVLARMSDPRLTDSQKEFLSTAEFAQLRASLRSWAACKVNLETLASLVERYELGREVRYAEVIAQLQQRLQWSEDAKLQALANHLQQHYRGANMRIAMSDVLMNRMLPQQEPIVSPVRDQIAGHKVRGQARTSTQLQVKLNPDPEAWHVSLEAKGKVYSHTKSDTWPARIRNAARMQYQASKEISLNEQGLKTSPTKATARGRNELVGVDSEFDPIPIVGTLLRDMARRKHSKSRPTANTQAKAKVVRSVKQRMDKTLEQKLDNFEQKFRDKVMAPIEALSLLAEPLDMHTTEQRAVMQLRLANSGQLAAHTLRPYAPSDSVLSVQLHETAINNAMMGLELDGQRMTLLELFSFVNERFGKSDATPPADMPQKAIIQFAKRDAVRVRCEGDQLELVLSVVELAHRRDRIKNFEIHVHFRPVLSGLSVKLVRDGTLQFSGRRLKTGPRVVLHSVLGKVLNEDRQYTLVSPKLMLDPRFQGLMVTQLVLEEGWIGLAIGPAHPRRTAWRAAQPEVLATPFVR